MTFEKALTIVRKLAKTQAFYYNLLQNLEDINKNDKEQVKIIEQDFEFSNVKDEKDLIFYFEN